MFRLLSSYLARIVLAALLWTLAGACAAQPPLWVVRNHGSTVVLFGSVHLLPAGLNWEPAKLKTAIAKADDIWFEIPIDEAASLSAAQTAILKGLQPPGSTLRGQLNAEQQARLAKIAAQCGVPVEGLDRLKPWLAEVTLSLAAYRQAGALQEDGVEKTLSSAARSTLKRRAFETPEEQIGYLSGASIPDQIASLNETLGELEHGADSYKRLVAAWMAGDTAAIETEAVGPLKTEAPGVYRTLVVDRNRRWISAIQDRLRQPGLSVMVVGVGHLVGSDSVPAMLRAQGLAVEGP